ncbi:putative cap-specific mRNA (nucleoside-2'-O-)-methyltransferase 2 isoform X2 [Apostichopus japonicus]|uniref:Cap-specific mRNA (nucleoside-2'-O-)-methyltransferase 2 n=1 Tax=Stichopus japonicus TaxID=307972 RepID=A0A2G8LP48_STIJA|nr:putative cap-specific mRNA (nucleoside-2'-O-)-methyltransferase 2 isoform X2 [Apostichopus japonicus]
MSHQNVPDIDIERDIKASPEIWIPNIPGESSRKGRDKHPSSSVEQKVEALFRKKFHFTREPDWCLPNSSQIFSKSTSQCEWKWLANTLNPYYEGNTSDKAILDDRLIKRTFEKWYFGVDDTGNLMELSNLEGLEKKVRSEFGNVQLVTADGSVNCQDNPAEQETLVHSLHFCEVVAALTILQQGGSFVLKMFTMFEMNTACLMYLLCVDQKPVTSKAGNSEVYVVCLGFQGIDPKMLDKLKENYGPTPNGTLLPPSSIPPSFWSQLYKASEKFKDYQMSTIEENMNLYENQDFYAMEEIKEIQRCCAERFYQTCQPIPTAEWICPGKSMKMSKNMSRQKLQGTWHERQSDKKMTHQEVVHRMEDQYRSTEQNGGLTQVAMKRVEVRDKKLDEFELIAGKPLKTITLSAFCSFTVLEDWNMLCDRSPVFQSLVDTSVKSVSWNDPVEAFFQLTPISRRTSVGFRAYQAGHFVRSSAATSIQGSSMQGNLDICETAELSKKFLTVELLDGLISRLEGKVDYIIADCCSMTDTISSASECQSQYLFLSALYIAGNICNPGANAVFFFPGLLTRFSAGLLFLLRMCFQEVTLQLPQHPSSFRLPVMVNCDGFEMSLSVQKIFERLLKKCIDLKMSDNIDVLESVPITTLLDTQFQRDLEKFNDSHLMQKICSLIEAELSYVSMEGEHHVNSAATA